MKTKLVLALVVMLLSVPAFPQSNGQASGWWLGADLGAGAVHSQLPAPSADRDVLVGSIDLGYRFTPRWGLGLEWGGIAPLGGCRDWQCAATPAEFAPNFTRVLAFGEYRPPQTGWRLRAGAGVSRFCYRRHWSETAWSVGDTLNLLLEVALDDDDETETYSGTGAWRCDAHSRALGFAASVGYDWPMSENSPVSAGWRLTAETARFGATSAIGLPAFRHRAVMLTLHLSIH